MSLGLDVHAELPFMRQQAESLMTDTIRVVRAGVEVWDEGTGQYVPGSETVYEGKGRLRDTNSRGRRVDDAAADTTIMSLMLSLPVGTPAGIGDVAVVVACPTNPALEGSQYRVMEPVDSSYASAARFIVERYSTGG